MVSCTTLRPAGLWKLPEEGEEPYLELEQVENEDGPKKLTNEFLSKAENWVHYVPHILREGRITHLNQGDNIEEEEDKVKFLKA